MSQDGEFFYVVAENHCLRSNDKIFEGHKKFECYESQKIEESKSVV